MVFASSLSTLFNTVYLKSCLLPVCQLSVSITFFNLRNPSSEQKYTKNEIKWNTKEKAPTLLLSVIWNKKNNILHTVELS